MFVIPMLLNQYKKKGQENFATGNAIYLLPRTIIQIANDNSIFHKEGIFLGIKTDYIPRAVVCLVSIFNCLAYMIGRVQFKY
jgi:hypothetical protein